MVGTYSEIVSKDRQSWIWNRKALHSTYKVKVQAFHAFVVNANRQTYTGSYSVPKSASFNGRLCVLLRSSVVLNEVRLEDKRYHIATL